MCWGGSNSGEADPPEGEKFTAIQSGHSNTCALREEGSALCWGYDYPTV